VIGLLVVAVAGLVGFAVAERHVAAPMVDFSFFRSRSFFGASTVAFIVSFAMLAMFFFLALYLQNILHYSPLEAGVRFLPSTAMIIVLGPIAGRLADRVGPKPLMTGGLVLVSAALFWESRLGINSSYLFLLPGFVLLGLGMGFVMSPMSTAAMNAVHQTKAGVASGILNMSRMVGGTFGVAVLGALIATLGRSRIDALLPHLPAASRARLADALGSGGGLGAGHVAPTIANAVRQAYVQSLGSGLRVGGAVALLGAVVAWMLISDRPEQPSDAPSPPSGEPVARAARDTAPELSDDRLRQPLRA